MFGLNVCTLHETPDIATALTMRSTLRLLSDFQISHLNASNVNIYANVLILALKTYDVTGVESTAVFYHVIK
jgi:hypothetical protein